MVSLADENTCSQGTDKPWIGRICIARQKRLGSIDGCPVGSMLDRLEVLNAKIRSIPASKLMDLCLPQAEGHGGMYPAQAQAINEMFGVHCVG